MRILWIFPALVSLLCLGCSAKPASTIVAKVNDYEVTQEEFKRELDLAERIHGEYPAETRRQMKAAVLDNIITRQVLLEEAQKQGFDKDPAFMREVESYWRQALIKAIVKKTTAELNADKKLNNIDLQARLDVWVKSLREKARVTKDAEAIDMIIDKP